MRKSSSFTVAVERADVKQLFGLLGRILVNPGFAPAMLLIQTTNTMLLPLRLSLKRK